MSDIDFCRIEPTNTGPSARIIMFWGDSHVQQPYPLIKKLHAEGEFPGERGALLAISDGCPPSEHLNRIQKGFHCDSFAQFALSRAEQEDVDTVFIGFSNCWANIPSCLSVRRHLHGEAVTGRDAPAFPG